MQKIKYPVGSKLKTDHVTQEIIISDISKNEFVAICFWQDGNFATCLSQEQIDKEYTLVSSHRWVPEIGEEYYFIDSGGHETCTRRGDEMSESVFNFRLKSNNIFKTSKECQNKIDEINSREI